MRFATVACECSGSVAGDPREFAVFEIEVVPAPVNGSAGVSADPDGERDEVAQRDQPEMLDELAVVQDATANHSGHRKTRGGNEYEQCPRPVRAVREDNRQKRTRQDE